jgi:hypothetical protein
MKAIKLHELDNVAVVLQPTPKNLDLKVDNYSIQTRDQIPVGHKIALKNITKNSEIVKYGKVIGLAAEDIQTGQHVHCHNVIDITEQLCDRFAREYRKGGI